MIKFVDVSENWLTALMNFHPLIPALQIHESLKIRQLFFQMKQEEQQVFDFKTKSDPEYEYVDLRSDTVSRSPQEMLEAMVTAELGDDGMEDDPTGILFQNRLAAMFGKEAAIIMPSATMSNIVSAKLYSQPGDEIILWGRSHFADRQGSSLAILAGLQTRYIESENGLFKVEDIMGKFRSSNLYLYPKTSLIFLENPTFVGAAWELEQLQKIKAFAEEKNLKVHVDGSRIFNALAYYKKKPIDFSSYFDSMTICLSKGLCCPNGAVLIGTEEFIKDARRMRKRLGGELRQVGMMAGAGLYALDKIYPQIICRDNQLACQMGKLLKEIPEIQINLSSIQVNMINFRFKKGKENEYEKFQKYLKENKFLISGFNPEKNCLRVVIHRTIQINHCLKFIQLTQSFFKNE